MGDVVAVVMLIGCIVAVVAWASHSSDGPLAF